MSLKKRAFTKSVGFMDITDPTLNSRARTAIEFLTSGQPFTIGEFLLKPHDSNSLTVVGASNYSNALTNLSRTLAIKELNGIKASFGSLLETAPRLKDFVKGKTLKYELICDSGKSAFLLCSEIDGSITWAQELPDD